MNLMTWWRPVLTVTTCARCRIAKPRTAYPRWRSERVLHAVSRGPRRRVAGDELAAPDARPGGTRA